MTKLQSLEEILGKGRVEQDKDLFQYITIRSHPKAEYFFVAKSKDDLQKAYKAAKELEIPMMFLGGGSNLAPFSEKIPGLVIQNAYFKYEIIQGGADSVDLLVSSGYPVSKLVADTVAAGYSGFEYHKGLPGSVGGAIYMNSKWTKPINYFGQNLLYAYILTKNGEIKKVDRDYFQFAYDYSILQKTKEFVLEAVFHLKKTDPAILKQRADDAFLYRKKTQPYGVATSGCFFRNVSTKVMEEKKLPTTSAGYLVDKAGLKGFSVGDYVVSDIHANFIVNRGQGKPADLVKLLNIIKSKVKDKFGIELKEEVIII